MPAVRLQDVADLAGVSLKTVSNVVRNKPHVSPATRKKVQRAVDELGYVPNMTARRLATGRTGMLELAFPDIQAPYYAEIASRMFDEAKKYDYRLLIEQTRNLAENERAVLADREQGLVDGVIFEPVSLETSQIALLKGDLSLVMLGEVEPPLTVDHVAIDNIAAAKTATQHLLDRGHKRIAFLASEEVNSSTVKRRLAGYESALREAGIEPDPDLYLAMEKPTTDGAGEAVVAALERGAEFDGLFCYNDMFAIGAMRALQQVGLQVPGDIGVVGWNDITMTRYSMPSLTTIAPDVNAMCSTALTMMMERIKGYDGIGRHKLVGYHLVQRESTGI
ncbi:MAG: LacI family transcriptional regulator [Bifidobacteriaceae bacterium]|jgi:DNA-binding LacI/PurR family transcriptional regulator|nr:LacI family transcriptional regulator [Bifidobacteriaceae bacterium]MCI1914293.1 LacI family transcriptional regulator [Bifidobacteriaceae bacterium]